MENLNVKLRSTAAGEFPDRNDPLITIRTVNSGRILHADARFNLKAKTFYIGSSVFINVDFWLYADELQPAAAADRIAAFLEL